jgi:suppressor of ftsI
VRSGAVGALTNPRHDDYMNEQALDMSEHSVEGRVIPRRTALLAGVAAMCLVAVFSAPLRAQSSYCNGAEPALAPSRDLYCIELVPAAGIRAGAGRVELGRSPGPFTVDVTADGHLRYTPAFTLSDLAPASALGRYTTYVAWAASPTMELVRRLGAVGNGRTVLPAIALDKFIILVTAEASDAVTEPRGRLVLRGMSPSTRLQPPDFMQFALGATRADSAGHAHHAGETGDSLRWSMVPMPADISMLPAEMTLRPDAAPYLPRPVDTAAVPMVRPRQLVRLASGDTLRLTAGVVRRPFKGQTLTMFAFNGQHPGPLLQVAQGAEVTVELTNALDQPTTVHWHGIRLDNAFDGVPDLTQRPVAPGERFTYRLRFPDAGIYWYHPHVREDIQQDLGLYGNLMVRSPRADYFSPAHREEVLMLDDLLVGDDGLVPFGAATTTHALMGRFGNVMLVNGEPRYELSVRRGEVVRFFLTNVSNTRTFNLSFPGARMKVVASDVGNYEREAWVESVVIGPAERYVVHVRFDGPGDVAFVNRVRGLDHLYGRFFQEADTLGVVRVGTRVVARDLARSFEALRADSAARADIARYRDYMTRPADKALVLTMEAQGLPFFTRQIMQLDSIFFTPVEWSGTMPGMNWAATGDQVRWILRDAATGKENMDIDWTFRRGDVVKVRLVNERRSFHGMQHPMHFHGQRFLVLAVNDVPNTNLVWKDTVLLPAGATADILLDLTNPGRWMVHCHIAEHLSAHMMMAFTVR